MVDDDLRRQALARVLTEHPEFVDASDPASVARLTTLVDQAEQQLRLQAEIEEVRRREFAEQARAEGERAKRARREAEVARLQEEERILRAEEAAKEAQREAALAAMNPISRWIRTHTFLSLGIAVTTVLAIAFGATSLLAQAQRTSEMAEREARLATQKQVAEAARAQEQEAREKSDQLEKERTARCLEGVSCRVGDVGPGGGIVFYDHGTKAPWGQFLEVAPADWAGDSKDPRRQWCEKGEVSFGSSIGTGRLVGVGRTNTSLIIEACGKNSAAGFASSYRGGGKDDWFLPSKGELEKIPQKFLFDGGQQGVVWSSTGSDWGTSALARDSSTGVDYEDVNLRFLVRPVRAF